MGQAKFARSTEISSEFEVFMFVMKHIWTLHGVELEILANRAEVSSQTLYNWRNGYVTKPRIDTVSKVLKAMGYELTWKKSKSTPKLRRV